MHTRCPDAFDDPDDLYAEPPSVTVDIGDEPVIGTILGPDGEPLHTVLAPRLPFGYGRR